MRRLPTNQRTRVAAEPAKIATAVAFAERDGFLGWENRNVAAILLSVLPILVILVLLVLVLTSTGVRWI